MKKVTSHKASDFLSRIKDKPCVICPVCGIKLSSSPGHRWKWNGNMFDSRLVCPNNPNGVISGQEYKQPD